MIKGEENHFYFGDFKKSIIRSQRRFSTDRSNGFTLIELLVVTPARKASQAFVRGKSPSSQRAGGFTLIELLVVIAILAVLAVAVVLVLNPAQLLAEARDSTRLSDLASLNTALALFQVDQYDQNMGTASTTYISIPDTSPTCSDLGLPALPIGWSYYCVPAASSSAVNGTGWVPVDFDLISSGAPLSRLPIDPINSTSTGEYYTYTPGGSFELTALMESTKYRAQVNADPSLSSYPNVVAMGSDLDLSPIYSDNPATLPVAYWPLDEDAGTTAHDFSGNGLTGTIYGGPTWQSGSSCVIGSCLFFNQPSSENMYVNIPDSPVLDKTSAVTISAWFQTSLNKDWSGIVDRLSNSSSFTSGYALREAGSDLYFSLYTTGSGAIDLRGTNIVDGKWHLGVGTYDSATGSMLLYVDGQLVATGMLSGSIVPGTNPLYIGRDGRLGYDRGFDGSVDDVRIYDQVLSAAEIQALYNAGK